MPLRSKQPASDQSLAHITAMATPSPVNLSSTKNKGARFRVSDTSGNVTAKKMKAGGPGSGRKKEIEDHLKSMGFEKHKVYGGDKEGNAKDGSGHWSKTIINNPHGLHSGMSTTTHGVHVKENGEWTHIVTGSHNGNNLSELANVSLAASGEGAISGRSLVSLKEVLATSFSEGKRKKLAKNKQAEPDGSFPIRNTTDLRHAREDLGRSGNKASDRAWINKRAKQLAAGGPGSGRRKEGDKEVSFEEGEKVHINPAYGGGKGRISEASPSGKFYNVKNKGSYHNSDLSRHPWTASSVKALGEDNLSNKKIMKYMEKQSASVTVKASQGTMTVTSGGPGSGRHITVNTHDADEVQKMHDGLVKKGFKMKDKSNYVHKNGDRVTMNYKAGGSGSGRKAGLALGKMLRQALIKRMGKAIGIAHKDPSFSDKYKDFGFSHALKGKMTGGGVGSGRRKTNLQVGENAETRGSHKASARWHKEESSRFSDLGNEKAANLHKAAFNAHTAAYNSIKNEDSNSAGASKEARDASKTANAFGSE